METSESFTCACSSQRKQQVYLSDLLCAQFTLKCQVGTGWVLQNFFRRLLRDSLAFQDARRVFFIAFFDCTYPWVRPRICSKKMFQRMFRLRQCLSLSKNSTCRKMTSKLSCAVNSFFTSLGYVLTTSGGIFCLFLHSFHCSSAYSWSSHFAESRRRWDSSRWTSRKPDPATNDPTSADGTWNAITDGSLPRGV